MTRVPVRAGALCALGLLAACGGASLGPGGGGPPGARQIAPAGDLLLDVSGDGLYALLVHVPDGALSIVPLAAGAASIPAGSLGALPPLPLAGRFQLPFGEFAPPTRLGIDAPLDHFVASAARPDGSVSPAPLFLGSVQGGAVVAAAPVDPAFGGPVAFSPDGSSLLFVGGASVPSSTPARLRRIDLPSGAVTTVAEGVTRPVLDYLPNGIGVASWVDPTMRPFLDTIDASSRAAPLAYPFPTYAYEQPIRFQVAGANLVVLQTDSTNGRAHLLSYPPVPWSGAPVDLADDVTSFVATGPTTVAYTALARESALFTAPVDGGAPTVIQSSGVAVVYDASPDGRYLHASGGDHGLIFDTWSPGAAPVAETPCTMTTPAGDTCAFLAAWSPWADYLLDFGWDLGLAPSPPFPSAAFYDAQPSSIALASPGTRALDLPGAPAPGSYRWAPPIFLDSGHVLLERLDRASAAGDLYEVDLSAGTSSLVAASVLDVRPLPHGGPTPVGLPHVILFTVGPASAPAGVYETAVP